MKSLNEAMACLESRAGQCDELKANNLLSLAEDAKECPDVADFCLAHALRFVMNRPDDPEELFEILMIVLLGVFTSGVRVGIEMEKPS